MTVISSYQDIGLHNVAEIEPADGSGVYLRRFPNTVRQALSNVGRMVSQESSGVELRFVTDAPNFRISLSTRPSVLRPYECHFQDAFVFRGAYFHSHHRLEEGRLNHINITNLIESASFDSISPKFRDRNGFSHKVWRVMLGRYPAAIHEVDTYGYTRRPPTPEELPACRWIAYGSSITHGGSPTVHHGAYVYHAARVAGLDVCNLGLSGSCQCEPEMAAYLASREDWHVMTLEIGVNMRWGYSPEQFRQRAEFLVDRISGQHPDRRLVLITIFPNNTSSQFSSNSTSESTVREDAFNAILREMATSHRYPNLSLIEGSQVLDDITGLSVDLVHPSDYGHARMGMNLGARLAKLCDSPTSGQP